MSNKTTAKTVYKPKPYLFCKAKIFWEALKRNPLIPIVQHLENKRHHQKGHRKIAALIVTPTRELAIQIGESFKAYSKFTSLKNTVIFGGVGQGASQSSTMEWMYWSPLPVAYLILSIKDIYL